MNNDDGFEAHEALRRLGDALAGPPPDEDESRRMCAEVGVDLDALYARVMAQVRAYEGAASEEEASPKSGPRRMDADREAPASEQGAPSAQVLSVAVARTGTSWSTVRVGIGIAVAVAAGAVFWMQTKAPLAPRMVTEVSVAPATVGAPASPAPSAELPDAGPGQGRQPRGSP